MVFIRLKTISTRSYPLKVRMGGNSDDSPAREPSEVMIIELL